MNYQNSHFQQPPRPQPQNFSSRFQPRQQQQQQKMVSQSQNPQQMPQQIPQQMPQQQSALDQLPQQSLKGKYGLSSLRNPQVNQSQQQVNFQQSRNRFKQNKIMQSDHPSQPYFAQENQENFTQNQQFSQGGGNGLGQRGVSLNQQNQQIQQNQQGYVNLDEGVNRNDVSDLNLTVYTNDSFLDQSQEFEQNSTNILAFNKCLIDAYEQFGSQDIRALIHTFQNALQVAKELKVASQKENILLIKTNLGVAYYYDNQVSLAAETLQEALLYYQSTQQQSMLKSQKSKKRQAQNTENMDSIYLKILCNLLIVSLSQNKLDEVQEIANELLSFISQNQEGPLKGQKKQVDLLQEAIYLLFRVPSLSKINEDYIESIKSGLQGANLGCFLIIVALSKELENDLVTALALYEEAFENFCSENDCLFMLLSLRHICRIYSENDPQNPDFYQYQQQYELILQEDNIKNLNLVVLFENFDQRVEAAKQLAEGLTSLERVQQEDQAYQQNQQNNNQQGSNFMDSLQDENRELWKRAIRYNLSHSIKGTDELLQNRELSQVQFQQLQQSKEQLTIGLQLFEKENNPVVLQKLISDKYSRESLRLVRASCERIKLGIKKLGRLEFFNKLRPAYEEFMAEKYKYQRKPINQLKSEYEQFQISKRQSGGFVGKLNLVLQKALKIVKRGDMLWKLNLSSGGGHYQFFKVVGDSLRWTNKEANIDSKKLKGVKNFKFADILRITFGHKNKTFLKNKKNRGFLPFLCFTIWTKKRPFDIYCPDEDEERLQFDNQRGVATEMSLMNAWFIGLSYLVKTYNPQAEVLSSGEFLWEKQRSIMMCMINEAMGVKNKLDENTAHVKVIKWFSLLQQFEEQQQANLN